MRTPATPYSRRSGSSDRQSTRGSDADPCSKLSNFHGSVGSNSEFEPAHRGTLIKKFPDLIIIAIPRSKTDQDGAGPRSASSSAGRPGARRPHLTAVQNGPIFAEGASRDNLRGEFTDAKIAYVRFGEIRPVPQAIGERPLFAHCGRPLRRLPRLKCPPETARRADDQRRAGQRSGHGGLRELGAHLMAALVYPFAVP